MKTNMQENENPIKREGKELTLETFFDNKKLMGLKGEHVHGSYEISPEDILGFKILVQERLEGKKNTEKLEELYNCWPFTPIFCNELMQYMEKLGDEIAQVIISDILKEASQKENKLSISDIEALLNEKVLGFIVSDNNEKGIADQIEVIVNARKELEKSKILAN